MDVKFKTPNHNNRDCRTPILTKKRNDMQKTSLKEFLKELWMWFVALVATLFIIGTLLGGFGIVVFGFLRWING